MKQLFTASVLLAAGLVCQVAHGSLAYWDPEGTGTESATSLASTWDTSTARWSSSSAVTTSLIAFPSTYAAVFCAGSTTVTTPFVVTLNSTATIGGIFNGTLNPPGVFVTISGTGSLNLASGADAFATGGSDGGTTTINVPLTGPGQIALEGGGGIYLNGTNTFTGGTSIGYPGVLAFTGTVYFSNGLSFGTGALTMTTSGAGGTMKAEGTASITITNSFVAANVAFNIFGTTGGLTFSGPWNLSTTPFIGVNNLVTISGIMSGTGGFTKYGTGALVLSGANTYSGGTTISNGVLTITADNNLGAAPTVANYSITLAGGTLNASNSFTLNSNRLIQLATASSIGVSTGNTLTYGGIIGGSVGFTKTGSGTLALSGADGYTGTTTISAGTLEADSTGGSSTGSNTVTIGSAGTLSGAGFIGGPVTGTGTIAPGTAVGVAKLTLDNGLNLSSGGKYSWTLASESTTSNFSSILLNGGNLALGGSSKLSLNLTGSVTAPNTNDPFWLTQEEWTIINTGSSAVDSNSTTFASILNGSYSAGTFSNFVSGNGNIELVYLPNFPVLQTLYDAGPGFFGGENLILTNFSGLQLFVWATTNPSLAISNWTLLGPLTEQPLSQSPGYSSYSINVSPASSPTFYIAGNMNTGPYVLSPVATTIVTTPDFMNFTVLNTNVSISSVGVLGLLPPAPTILSGTLSSGQFQLQFSSVTNQNFIMQGSTDLMTWTNILTGTVTNSPTTVTDTGASNYNAEYYRIILPVVY